MQYLVSIWICSVVMTTGCAAIMQGNKQTIPVHSSPNTVSVDISSMSYSTPTILELERKNEYILTFSKDGYESTQIQITKHLSGIYLISDVLFTGLIGVIVDAATGAWYKLKPEAITVSLNKISSVPGPAEIEVAIDESRGSGMVDITSSMPDVIIQVLPLK